MQREPAPLCREQSVAVALCGDPIHDEVANMVVETLTQESVNVIAIRDGDARAWNRNVLLLTGSGRAYPQYAKVARLRAGQPRPRIVLWHLQPLPPPALTQRANDIGERLLAARWEDVLGSWASHVSRVIPAQGRVREVLQRVLAVSMREELIRLGGAEHGNVGWDDLCSMFEEAAWLSHAFAPPEQWIDEVASNTPTRVSFLRQCGIPARFVPLGFHPGWGRMNNNLNRDIDVLYVGTRHSLSRRSLVPEVLRQLRDWGYKTHESALLPCGEQRTSLLQRARIVLNVLRYPWEFPGPRLFASAACGALCISNEAVQNEPFQSGLHYVQSPLTRMAESISRYLTNEEERVRKATAALQSFTTSFPLLTSIQKLLETTPTVARQQEAA